MEQNIHITATFVWTFDDVKDTQRALAASPVVLSSKSSISSWLVYGLLALAIVWTIAKLFDEQKIPSFAAIRNNLPLIGMYLLPVIVLWATFTFAQKRNLKQGFSQSPDKNKRVIVTFTPDEIVMKIDGSYETRWKWAVLIEVRRTPKGFCFFQAPKFGFWIPVRAFQTSIDIETVSELARRLTPKFSVTAI